MAVTECEPALIANATPRAASKATSVMPLNPSLRSQVTFVSGQAQLSKEKMPAIMPPAAGARFRRWSRQSDGSFSSRTPDEIES